MSRLWQQELETYREVWASQRGYSHDTAATPGLRNLALFKDVLGPQIDLGGTLLDVGCGDGTTGLAYRDLGFDVTLSDLSDEWLVPEARALPFVPHAVWQPFPQMARLGGRYDVVTAVDVLEHVPEAFTMLAVSQLLHLGRRVFLTIALQPDTWGIWVGKPLHRTVQPFTWWRDHLREVGVVLECRDCLAFGLYWMRA